MQMNRRIACGAVIAICGATTVAGCGSGEDSSSSDPGTKTLTYGLLTPLSGSAASWGKVQEASVKLAIDKVNGAGGIKVKSTTYKLKLKVYDHAYDPTKAATAARQAFDEDNAKFAESLGGGVIAAVQPSAERQRALLFCSCLGTSYLGKDHPLTFKPYHDTAQALGAMLDVFKREHPQAARIAQIYTDDDVGHGAIADTKGIIAQHGLQGTVTYVGRDATDFYPVLTKVLRSRPDVIDVGPSPEGLYVGLIKQATELGFHGQYVFPDVLSFDSSKTSVPKGSLTGSLSAPCNIGASTPVAKTWATAIEHATGEAPQWWSAADYDNVLLLAAAIQKAQSVDPSAVADALGQVTVEGATAGGSKVGYGGADRLGLPRAFQLDYPVCEVAPGGSGGRGELKQVTAQP